MAEKYVDQASGLRRLFSHKPLRVVTFVSGSGGVGKSALVRNVAACLAKRGVAVLILDESAEKPKPSQFGTSPQRDLFQVVSGECGLADVLSATSPGVQILQVAETMKKLGVLDRRQQHILTESLCTLETSVDVILVDASQDHPFGLSPLVLVAHSTVVVMSTTAASITQAYALIKKASLNYARRDYRVVVNGARSQEEARSIFRNLSQVAYSRGVARLDFSGAIPRDEHVQQAANLGQPVEALFPETMVAGACRKLAEDLLDWDLSGDESNSLDEWVQQLLQLSRHAPPLALYA